MTHIFISHSHSDKAIAFKLVNFLLAALRVEEEEILGVAELRDEFMRNWNIPEFKIVN